MRTAWCLIPNISGTVGTVYTIDHFTNLAMPGFQNTNAVTLPIGSATSSTGFGDLE